MRNFDARKTRWTTTLDAHQISKKLIVGKHVDVSRWCIWHDGMHMYIYITYNPYIHYMYYRINDCIPLRDRTDPFKDHLLMERPNWLCFNVIGCCRVTSFYFSVIGCFRVTCLFLLQCDWSFAEWHVFLRLCDWSIAEWNVFLLHCDWLLRTNMFFCFSVIGRFQRNFFLLQCD